MTNHTTVERKTKYICNLIWHQLDKPVILSLIIVNLVSQILSLIIVNLISQILSLIIVNLVSQILSLIIANLVSQITVN
jgi:hypothetical protein